MLTVFDVIDQSEEESRARERQIMGGGGKGGNMRRGEREVAGGGERASRKHITDRDRNEAVE